MSGEEDEIAIESLLEYRRDAVASILMNLYVLAGALRGGRGVPVSLSFFSSWFFCWGGGEGEG